MRIDVIHCKLHTLKLRRPLGIHNGGCFVTLNLHIDGGCDMFTFCVVLNETKRKTQTNSRECVEIR